MAGRSWRILVATAWVGAFAGCRPGPQAGRRTSLAPPASGPAQAASSPRSSFALDTTARDPGAQLEGAGAFIDSVFRARLGEAPRMGWFYRGHFLAEERHPRIHILAAGSTVVTGQFARVAGPAEHEAITARAAIACEDSAPLAVYDVATPPPDGERRALFLSRRLPRLTRVALTPTPLDARAKAAVRALLPASGTAVIYRDTGLVVVGTRFRYALGAAYDSGDHTLLRATLVLEDSAGHVLGSVTQGTTDFECDGCGLPTLESGFGSLYAILNGFVASGFPYPVLLLDTSTVEGRALSLVTFAPGGAYGAYRIYEYVVNCVLSEGQ